MANIDDGGSAFPHDNQELGDKHRIAQSGMSLRDFFAAQIFGTLIGYHGFTPEFDNYQRAARDAYTAADAMLMERSRRESSSEDGVC